MDPEKHKQVGRQALGGEVDITTVLGSGVSLVNGVDHRDPWCWPMGLCAPGVEVCAVGKPPLTATIIKKYIYIRCCKPETGGFFSHQAGK